MDNFVTDAMPLSGLLDQAHVGTLQLPDFQRGWVWDDSHIRSLLASVSLSYPIGAVMTLRNGNPDVRFKPRVLEGVRAPATTEPELLLLDGQQRTTSLYQALRSGLPVATRDSRGNDMSRRYFADIKACIDPQEDREEAIISVPADGTIRTFRGEVTLDVSTRESQVDALMFPLDIVLDSSETTLWQLEFLAPAPAERLQMWFAFNAAVIAPFVQYRVPTIELARATPKEAVCQVFEKVNTGGVSLTVFELLTATYAADDVNLRDDWIGRQAGFAKHAVLDQFRSTDFLQVITLLTTRDRRAEHLALRPGDDRAPAVSCKRREILRLDVRDYQQRADLAAGTMERVVRFLHRERIFSARDVPYGTQLVPLAAIIAVLGERAESHGVAQKLRQWFWCGVFGEMYGGATETRFALDLPDVVAWIDGGAEPRTVAESQFQAARLLTLRSRNSAAYKGVYALQMKRGARHFRTMEPIDMLTYRDDSHDVWLIFPTQWCARQDVPVGRATSIVNKTVVDAQTGRRIGSRAPSDYLGRIENVEDIEPSDLDATLRSHDIDPIALRRDDFPAFFTARFERLIKQIEDATGKSVNRAADGSDNPYAVAGKEHATDSVRDVIATVESTTVEFKSTGRKNLKTGEKDPAMEWGVLKSIAGFMNTGGGTLLVGVADDGTTVGLEEDYAVMSKKNTDAWELWLTDALTRCLGKAAATDATIDYVELNGRTVARIDIAMAAQPVFATSSKGDHKDAFMVRVNSSTREFAGREMRDYQLKRWPS